MKNEQNSIIPSAMLEQLKAHESSGQNRSYWCKEHGIGYHKFNYWWKKWKSNAVSEVEDSSFVPVKVQSVISSGQIEIVYSDNVRVRFPADINITVVKSLLPFFSSR